MSEEQWNFSIYLVGFPDVKGDSSTSPIATHMKRLLSEARIFNHSVFQEVTSKISEHHGVSDESVDIKHICGPENSRHDGNKYLEVSLQHGLVDVFGTSGVLSDPKREFFLLAWIEDEAIKLLDHIRQNVLQQKGPLLHRIVLAGHGFAGIVVKKAVTMANTTKRFYDVALAIDALLFIDSPLQPTDQQNWDELLLKMLDATNISYRGRLAEIHPGLIGSLSQISYDFCQFAAEYRITSIIRKVNSDEFETTKFNTPFEEVIPIFRTRDEMLRCSMQDAEYLGLLKKLFTPRYVNRGCDVREHRLQSDIRIDSYFELLQRLSSSQWLMRSNKLMDRIEDFEILKKIYHPYLTKSLTKEIMGRSIEIVNPKLHGGSTLLRLLCREVIESSPVVLIDGNNIPQRGENTRYNMYMSSIHQIISQWPSLFLPIQSMAIEIMSQNVWTEEVLHTLLSSILINSNRTKFVVVIDDFESWPFKLHFWISMIQNNISKAMGSTLSILTCSRKDIIEPTQKKLQKIKLRIDPEKHAGLMTAFIHAKLDHFLSQNLGSASARAELKAHILKTAIPLVHSFEGSFSSMNAYLMNLVYSNPPSSIRVIRNTMQGIPVTRENIYRHFLQDLFHRPKEVLSWAAKVLSWLLLALRPLHIKELAVAAALAEEHLTLDDVRDDISLDIEKDIREHLGPFVRIEGQFAYLDSQELKSILLLSDGNSPKEFKILSDHDLVRNSLRYIYLAFTRSREKEETWENCLSQISHKYQGRGYDEPVLYLLEYACRFWPMHVHRCKGLDENLKTEVLQFFKQQSYITNMWFRLYLLCHGQVSKPFTQDPELEEMKVQVLDDDDTTVDETYGYQPRPVIEMADYVGLSTIILVLLPDLETDVLKEDTARRGYWDHKVVIRDTKSRDYLDLIIENDDEVEELFNANRKEMDGHFLLHRAAISGRLRATKVLFNILNNHNPLLSHTNSDGRTPLHMAAICGSEEVLRFLISKAVSDTLPDILDAKDNYSETALMVAVRMGNVVAAKILVESGAKVNTQDDAGRTVLHFAASNCPQLITSLMTANNGIAFMADHDGCTPLHIATKCASLNATSFLLEASGELGRLSQIMSAKDNAGKTAMHYAAELGLEEIIRFLASTAYAKRAEMDEIEKVAEIAAISGHIETLRAIVGHEDMKNFGHQVLNAAACSDQLLVVYYLLQNHVPLNKTLKDGHIVLSNVLSKGSIEVVRVLLEHGADVQAADSKGRKPLHHAAEHGMYEIAEMLLAHQPISDRKAMIEAKDLERYRPLHYAARAGEVKMVEFLLHNNAKIDAPSAKQQTPLHVAVEHPAMMQLLIDAGADLNAIDHIQRTLLHCAISKRAIESVRFLFEQGASLDAEDFEYCSPMRYAIEENDAIIVEAIIQFQSSLSKPLEIPWKDLLTAIDSSALEALRILIKELPSIITKTGYNGTSRLNQCDDGSTLLHRAAEFSEIGILHILLDAGSDIGALSITGETPLFRAVISNKADNLRLLIKRGGMVNECRKDGWMPLHIAAYCGHIESAVALLEGGASINQLAVCQATPLYLAQQENMVEMAKLLLKRGADPNLAADRGTSPVYIDRKGKPSRYLLGVK